MIDILAVASFFLLIGGLWWFFWVTWKPKRSHGALLGVVRPRFEDDTRCTVPDAGWFCTRSAGHDGPCAAWPGKAKDYA